MQPVYAPEPGLFATPCRTCGAPPRSLWATRWNESHSRASIRTPSFFQILLSPSFLSVCIDPGVLAVALLQVTVWSHAVSAEGPGFDVGSALPPVRRDLRPHSSRRMRVRNLPAFHCMFRGGCSRSYQMVLLVSRACEADASYRPRGAIDDWSGRVTACVICGCWYSQGFPTTVCAAT